RSGASARGPRIQLHCKNLLRRVAGSLLCVIPPPKSLFATEEQRTFRLEWRLLYTHVLNYSLR
ncbi:MAG: hypothetical protein ACK5CP_02395, partial [Bacteroidota bacterium]